MANGLRIIPQEMQSVDSADFDGTFQQIGDPLPFAVCLIKFVNNSNADAIISWNGITDHDIIPAGGFALYDICSDAGAQRGLYVAQGTQFWVSGAMDAANAGLVYMVCFNTSEY